MSIAAKDLAPGMITTHGTVTGIYPWKSVTGQDVLTVEFHERMSETRFPDEPVAMVRPY